MSRSMISKEVLMDAEECEAGGAIAEIFSNSRKFHDCTGVACVLLTTSTNQDIGVRQECSTDNVTWYKPETNAAAAGVVETSRTATGTVYMSYTPVLCDYIRFSVINAGTSNFVSITLVYRVEV
jgi:hypothetical protein